MQNNAPAIWNRLQEEYGQILDIEYIRADYEFHALKKDSRISMNDHINRFTKLLQDVEYNKPPNVPPKDPGIVNLTFIASLGKDWETFQQAKGATLRPMKTSMLYAEVRAIDARNSDTQTTSSQPSDAKALSTQFDGNRQGRGGWNDGKQGNKGGKGQGNHKVNGGFKGRG